MNNERKQILEMLSAGKVTVEEAEKLLAALNDTTSTPQSETTATENTSVKREPKFLRVVVDGQEDGSPSKVNVKVPWKLIKAGVKLGAWLPKESHDHVNEALHKKGFNMDLGKMKAEDLEELLMGLGELEVDVNDSNQKVRVFCE